MRGARGGGKNGEHAQGRGEEKRDIERHVENSRTSHRWKWFRFAVHLKYAL